MPEIILKEEITGDLALCFTPGVVQIENKNGINNMLVKPVKETKKRTKNKKK